jgi:uncharacterized cupin superfamily protein
MKPAIKARDIPSESTHFAPEPFASRLGVFERRRLADHFGLRRIGVHLETLQPGSRSALRHWHTRSDELAYVLEGELTLVTNDGESLLGAGMCIGFRAGVENAHHLVNNSQSPATLLVVGARVDGDDVIYPDDDLQWRQDESGNWQPLHKDGTPY